MTDNAFHFFISHTGRNLSGEVGYSPGKKLYCPKCNSEKISIFFKPGFSGKDLGDWCDYIAENNLKLLKELYEQEEHWINI